MQATITYTITKSHTAHASKLTAECFPGICLDQPDKLLESAHTATTLEGAVSLALAAAKVFTHLCYLNGQVREAATPQWIKLHNPKAADKACIVLQNLAADKACIVLQNLTCTTYNSYEHSDFKLSQIRAEAGRHFWFQIL